MTGEPQPHPAVPPPPAMPPATPWPAPPPPPPPEARWRARRIEPVPGTGYGVVLLDVPPVTSGLAVGALISGVASIIVSGVVGCFGVAGARAGWGGWAAGAFTVLGVLLGVAGILLGVAGRRQTQRPAPPPAIRFSGRPVAMAGAICSAIGLFLTLSGFGLALLLQLG